MLPVLSEIQDSLEINRCQNFVQVAQNLEIALIGIENYSFYNHYKSYKLAILVINMDIFIHHVMDTMS